MTLHPRIAAICRSVVRRETYEWCIAPAIADLEFESNTFVRRFRGYVGLWRALVGAVIWDANHWRGGLGDIAGRRLPFLNATSVGIVYVATWALFLANMAAGGRRLRDGTVLSHPTLRVMVGAAVTALALLGICWLTVLVLSRSLARHPRVHED